MGTNAINIYARIKRFRRLHSNRLRPQAITDKLDNPGKNRQKLKKTPHAALAAHRGHSSTHQQHHQCRHIQARTTPPSLPTWVKDRNHQFPDNRTEALLYPKKPPSPNQPIRIKPITRPTSSQTPPRRPVAAVSGTGVWRQPTLNQSVLRKFPRSSSQPQNPKFHLTQGSLPWHRINK